MITVLKLEMADNEKWELSGRKIKAKSCEMAVKSYIAPSLVQCPILFSEQNFLPLGHNWKVQQSFGFFFNGRFMSLKFY